MDLFVYMGAILFLLFAFGVFVVLPLFWYKQNFKYKGIVLKEDGTLDFVKIMLVKDEVAGIYSNIVYAEKFKDVYKYLFYKIFHKVEINTIPFEFFPTTENWFFVRKRSGELRQVEFKTLTDDVKFFEGDIGVFKAKYTANQKAILTIYQQQGALEKIMGVLFVVIFFIGVVLMFSTASETAKNITQQGAQASLELSTKLEKAMNGTYQIDYCKNIWYLMDEIRKNESKKDVFVLK